MSEYVNNSNANITNGLHAPQVNYQQIPILNKPQPMPNIDPGGHFDVEKTVKSYFDGRDKAKKETNEKAKNEYALEIRKLTAAREQGHLDGLAFQTAVRTAGERALSSGALNADEIAEIESKHSFGYLSTEQKRRDQEIKNSIEFDKNAINHLMEISPSMRYMGYDNAKKVIYGLKADKETADYYSQKYLETGDEDYKPFATKALSNMLKTNFEKTLIDKYLSNGVMPTQADVNSIVLLKRKQLTDAGYPEDMVDTSLGIAKESSNLKMYADVEEANRTFTIQQQKDILTDSMQRTEMDIYNRYPGWRIAKALNIEDQLAEGMLRDLPVKEQDRIYKNVQDVFLEGIELTRDISQSKAGGAVPYTMINSVVNNPAVVTPATGVNTLRGSLGTILRDNSEAIQNGDPSQVETASKNLGNVDEKGARSYLEKQLTSSDPKVARQAQAALDALDGISAAKLAIKLKTVHNSPFKGLEGSTANERMYADPLTGDLKLRRTFDIIPSLADVFYGKEFEGYVKDINTLVNEVTENDPEKKIEFFNKYFGLNTNPDYPVKESSKDKDTSNLYRDGEEGQGGNIGGYAGLGGMAQIKSPQEIEEERTARAEKKAEEAAKKEAEHQVYLDTFRDLTKPTIDIDSLPIYDNGDGTTSSMKTITIEEDNKHILIPTIRTENGQRIDMNTQEAIDWYHKTGGHFGKYDTDAEAKKFAEKFSADQGEKSKDYAKRAQAHLPIAAKKYGVDENLLSALFEQESAKGTNLKSATGVRGAMQITEKTWNEEIAPALGFTKEDRKNPEKQMEGGAWYLNKLLGVFDGEISKAVAAYNGGAEVIRKSAEKYGDEWMWPEHLVEFITYFEDADKKMQKAEEIAKHVRKVLRNYANNQSASRRLA